MAEGKDDVRIHIASANTKLVTELCVRSMQRTAGHPYELYVGDVGSRDGSVEMLKKLGSDGFIQNLEVAMGWRQHFEWLDGWLKTCDRRYAVFVDSDVVFLKPGWLADMLDVASRTGSALVCAEMGTEKQNVVDAPSGKKMRLAARPCLHLLLLDVPQVAGISPRFFPILEETDTVLEGAVMYDTGAKYFADLLSKGLSWTDMPSGFGSKFHHFGGMSWRYRKLWPGWAMAKRLAKIRGAVLLYRTVWRSRPAAG